MRTRLLAVVTLCAALLAACSSDPTARTPTGSSASGVRSVDVGGYSLSYGCVGHGSPTVSLDAGLGTAGDDEMRHVACL